jgi:hypothetical protein
MGITYSKETRGNKNVVTERECCEKEKQAENVTKIEREVRNRIY